MRLDGGQVVLRHDTDSRRFPWSWACRGHCSGFDAVLGGRDWQGGPRTEARGGLRGGRRGAEGGPEGGGQRVAALQWVSSTSSWAVDRLTLLEAKDGLQTRGPISARDGDATRPAYRKIRHHVRRLFQTRPRSLAEQSSAAQRSAESSREQSE